MVQLRILILIMAASALACSKATPQFDLLDPNAIPQPKFSGATVKSINSSSDTDTYAITGECDPKIQSITAMAVGVASSFASLDSVAASAPTVACSSSGTFSFSLKSLVTLGYSVAEGTTYEIQLKGFTSAGLSNPSYIRIRYASPVSAPRLMISGGGVHSTPTNEGRRLSSMSMTPNFQAVVRMNYMQHPHHVTEDHLSTSSGSTFKAHLGGVSR
jgi:hypothetical protein